MPHTQTQCVALVLRQGFPAVSQRREGAALRIILQRYTESGCGLAGWRGAVHVSRALTPANPSRHSLLPCSVLCMLHCVGWKLTSCPPATTVSTAYGYGGGGFGGGHMGYGAMASPFVRTHELGQCCVCRCDYGFCVWLLGIIKSHVTTRDALLQAMQLPYRIGKGARLSNTITRTWVICTASRQTNTRRQRTVTLDQRG